VNVVVLWGGGLGDALVLRPLLQAWHRQGISPLLTSTASHAPDVIKALGLEARSLTLPPRPLEALGVLRRLRPIDLLYLSPYSPWKTRLLARLANAQSLWISRPRMANQFFADVVCDDIAAMRLTESPTPPYGNLPLFQPATAAPVPRGALLIHPGSRSNWLTRRWPTERWIELLRALRRKTDLPMVAVGTATERKILDDLCHAVPGLNAHSQLSLAQLESCVAQASLVICTNSGVMHLALAHQRPTVVLTGASARFWRSPDRQVRNVSSGRCELACNRARCPIPGYDARCIKQLEVPAVMAAVESVLGGHLTEIKQADTTGPRQRTAPLGDGDSTFRNR
jgi:hypothetical protein